MGGHDTTAGGDYSTARDLQSSASGQGSTAWGGYILEGIETHPGGAASGLGSTAFGSGTSASAKLATAWGANTEATAAQATVWGANTHATGAQSTAFGNNSNAAANNSLAAPGGTVNAGAANSAAIGNGATATLADTVALGSGSVADRAAGDTNAYLKGANTGSKWVATNNAIAVGDDDTVTRQITGVAAGSQDTDAVNVAQLKALAAQALSEDSLGDRSNYTEQNYIRNNEAVARSLDRLDIAVDRINRNAASAQVANEARFKAVEHSIDKLENKMEKGLEANNALAALVPLNGQFKTQISVALGGYESNQALAVGAFHHVSDRVLINTGIAYGGNRNMSYNAGVTFGF